MLTGSGYRMELQRAAREKIGAAKAREASGDLAGAAGLLRSAAGILRGLAGREAVQADRVRLFRKANDAERMAEELSAGRHVFGQAQPVTETAPQEDYAAHIDDLIRRSPATWDDIGGMATVKTSLKYTMGLMLARMPEGVRIESASRVLLFGPPGTGKTLLAAVCSNMLGATFFSVKASDLLSKYFGESPKLVSALYARARSEADTGAALVFIDEFDALCRKRGRDDETGAERRLLSTLLAELDGLAGKGEQPRVITVAATNRPWDISDAIAQRFEKQILVGLPDAAAREATFGIHLCGAGLELGGDVLLPDLARRTEGCSGREIQHICKHAVEAMIRDMNRNVPDEVDGGGIRDYVVRHRPLKAGDFEAALASARRAEPDDLLKRYNDWARRRPAA